MAPDRRWIALGLVALGVLAAFACRPCCQASRTRPTPGPTVAVSTEAAAHLEERIEGLSPSAFRFELSEEEATSYLALRVADTIPLASPQVRFLPGKIILEGDLTSPVRAHVILAGSLRAVDGRLEIELHEARAGAVTLPPLLLASLADSLSEQLSLAQAGIIIEEVDVRAGTVTVSGRSRQP